MTGARPAALAAAALLAAAAPAPGAMPRIAARAAFVVQPDTRDVVYAKRAGERRAMASTAKLMTALLALERFRLSQTLTVVPYRAAPGESVAGLRAGERMTLADLLRALLLASANDAAATLAVDVAGSQRAFVALMNQRARQLGLGDTRFANPIGLDAPGNYSSARDLVKLALLLRRNDFVRRIVDEPRARLRSGAQPRTVVNRNDLVAAHDFVDGVKTGHTLAAGYVLIGSATRDGVQVVSAVMGSPTLAARDADSLALLRYGLDRYERVSPVRAGQVVARPAVSEQPGRRAALVVSGLLTVVVRRGERPIVRLVGVPAAVAGPLPAGRRLGAIEVLHRGRVVARAPLVTARAVPRPTAGERVRSWLGRASTVALLSALAAATLSLVLLRRRVARRQSQGREPEAT